MTDEPKKMSENETSDGTAAPFILRPRCSGMCAAHCTVEARNEETA